MLTTVRRQISILLTTSIIALTLGGYSASVANASEPKVTCDGGVELNVVGTILVGDDYTSGCSGTVVIEEGITEIRAGALSGLSNISSVSIPASVTSIERYSIVSDFALTSIEVSASNPNFMSLDGVLFNKEQTELIAYPPNKANEVYEVPDGVERIWEFAFYNLRNLVSIDIPASVIEIESESDLRAFGNGWEEGTNFAAINVDAGNLNYSSEGGVLFNKDKSTLIAYPRAKSDATYEIPETVVDIRFKAFDDADSLTAVIIPDSVVTIGDSAFYQASNVTTVVMGDHVTSIGHFAFAYMTSLTSISLPNSVNIMGDSVFQGDRNLVSAVLSDSLYEIPYGTFSGAESLVSIEIPSDVSVIGSEAFAVAKALTEVTIPASVTQIGNSAFSGARNLERVIFLGSRAPSVGLWAFAFVDPEAIVNFPVGATKFCADPESGKWNGLILPEGTPICNCNAIEGATITESEEGWLLEWDETPITSSIDGIYIFIQSDPIRAGFYNYGTGHLLGHATPVNSTNYLAKRDSIEALVEEWNFDSITFVLRKDNGFEECFLTTTVGTVAFVEPPVEVDPIEQARIAEMERLLAVAKARDGILNSFKSGTALTLDALIAAEVRGATAKNIERINKELAAIPAESRGDLAQVLKVIRKYEVLDLFETQLSVARQSALLVEIGLISDTDKHKIALASALKSLSPADRSDYTKLTEAIAEKLRGIKLREAKSAEIRERVNERSQN